MEFDQSQLQEYSKVYGQVVAKAWADDNFKQRLLADPAAVFQEEGFPVPAGKELRVVENTDKKVYLMLPPKPTDDLSDEQLNQVAGGSTAGTTGTAASFSTLCGTVLCVGSLGTASSFGD